MILKDNIIYADNNCVLKDSLSNTFVGLSIFLGYKYYNKGKKLHIPRLIKAEDIEEINLQNLTNSEALINTDFYPELKDLQQEFLIPGDIFREYDRLYRVIKEHSMISLYTLTLEDTEPWFEEIKDERYEINGQPS